VIAARSLGREEQSWAAELGFRGGAGILERAKMRLFGRAVGFATALAVVAIFALAASQRLYAQQASVPAFVIVERLTTTGPESIQQQYGKISRDIVAKFGGRYLARSQRNELLEGEGNTPCCMAIISFPSMEVAKKWFNSQENQDAAKIRLSGATFRIVSIEGLP
jgi:uncharacterized protein (DUF1330 family)